MKKSLLRFMLLVTGLLLGANVAWAYTPALSADYTVAGYKYKAFYDISNENVDGMCPTEGDLRFRGEGFGLFNFKAGDRSADVTISLAKDDLLFVEFKDTQAKNVTVNSISHCTANATYTSGEFLAFDVTETTTSVTVNIGRAGCIIAILVLEKDNDAATADYTINYKFGGETVKTTTGNAAVGAVINTDASFFVGEVKYFRADGQPENLTVAAGGTTLDVVVRMAETWNYSITSSLGGTIFSGTGLEGETVYAPYPRYQLSGTTLYEAAATNKEYRKPFTMTADNLTAEVTYGAKVENVVFYTEGEKINGANVVTNGNIPVRASGAEAATVDNDAVLTQLPSGKYMFVVGAFTSKSKDWSNYAAKIGVGAETFTATLSAGNLNEITSEEYSLNESTEIKYLADGSSTDCALDYIYIAKTGDVEPVQIPILSFNGTVGEQVSLTFGVYDTEDEYSVDFGDGTLQTQKVGVNNAGPVNPETGQTTGATVFTGTVAGDGTIKVYGNNDVWYLVSSGAMPTTLDQAKLMNVVQMSISGTNEESVALPAYPHMTQFSFNNSPVKTVDVTKVTTLTSLNVVNTSVAATDMMLESIDLSKNTALENLTLGGTFYKAGVLKTIDLSKNTALKMIIVANQQLESIVLPEGANLTSGLNVAMNKLTALDLSKLGSLKTLNAYTNQIESLDLSKLTEGSDLYIKENKLTELNVPVSVVNLEAQNNQLTLVTITDATKSCKLEENALTLATLPAQPASLSSSSKTKKFTYAPQAAMAVEESVTELDLSSQLVVAKGELGKDGSYTTWYENVETSFTFKTASGTELEKDVDYQVIEPGKFKFIKEQTEKVHAEMLNAAFPKFTAAVPFKTTEFTVVPGESTPILTFTGTVGEQVSLTFGVYDTEDEYSVDFGDGTLQTQKVGVNNAGPVNPETGQTTAATVFTGTVAGDGTIKVYGNNDVWYLVSSGAMPTTLDQAKLMNVVQMSITGASEESLVLPAYPHMTQFGFNNSPLKSIDVSKVSTLTSLTINNTTSAATQLESIDVTNNTELTYLSLQGNANSYGKLTTLDLSKNTKLENIMVQYNALTEVTLGEFYPTGTVNFSCNQLTAFDGKFGKNSGFFDVSGNQLTELDLSEQVKKGTIKIQNNKFTLATLPTKPAITTASKYTYAPQPAYEVPSLVIVNDVVDLSSQLTAVGVGTEPATTTYSFVTGGETPATLVEGTDYEVVEPGKFKFLTAQAEKVYGVMATTAFPKFTGANAYKTTEFAVMVPEDITVEATDIAEGDITAAIATKTEGKLVKNITINLAKDVNYTVSAPIEAPASLFINGNGATVDASALEGDFITLKGSTEFVKKADESDSDHYGIDAVAINGVTINGLKGALVTDAQKTLVQVLTISNSIIEMPAAGKNLLNFNGKGYVGKVVVSQSTIWAAGNNTGFFAQYGSRPKNINADWLQEFDVQNSTIVNIAVGKNVCDLKQNGTAQNVYTLKNNIFVNVGKSGQTVVGFNKGQTSATPIWDVDGNTFNADGVDKSAAEVAKAGQAGDPAADIVKNCVAGVVSFTDAANGDFAGNIELPYGVEAPAAVPGDSRWTITFTNAPAPLYVIGTMNNWDRTAMTEMTFNAETQAYEYEYAPTTAASLAFSDKLMTAEEAEADADWSVFNANRYAIGEGDQNAKLNEAVALQKVNGTILLAAGTYKISVAKDMSTITITGEVTPPTPVTVEKLFIIGNGTPKGWDGTTELTFNETTQAFEYEATVTGDTYLSFGDAEWTSWDEFNGKHRFAPAEGNTDAVLDQAVQLVLVNEGCVVLKTPGAYKISVTKDLKMTITATGTGINSIAADKMKDATIYTISGQRVEKAQKGLYIINGKKVVIK